MEENDVRNDLCTSVFLESVIGQTDGSQQLGTLGKIAAHGGILGVHRIAAGDKGHHAAGTHLVQCFGEKVVVNAKVQLIVGFIPDLILTKRYIADGKVKEVTPVGGLKAAYCDVRLGIELLCDAPGNRVQLHAVQTTVSHFLRQHTEEIAHTHRRLQNISGLKSHTAHRFIDGLNDRRAGVMGVEGGASGGGIFLRGQQLFQLGILGSPCRFLRVKGIRETAPAHISRKNLLLFGACLLSGSFQLFQQTNRIDICLELGFRTAFAQMLIGNAKVFCIAAQVSLVFLIRCFLGSFGIGKGLPLAIDLNGNRVFIQHFLKGFLRLSHRGWRLRLLDMQSFHHHIIRQIVLIARIDGHGLGMEGRGFGSRLGLFLSKTVLLTGIHPAQQRRNLIPAEIQHSQTLFLCIHDFQFYALCRGTVIGNIAGLQIQCLNLTGIGSAQPVGDLAVAPAGLQQRGNLLFIRFIHQSMSQYIPQVLICLVRVNGKKLGIVSIAAVCPKQLLELFFALCPVDGIYHPGGQKLYGVLPQLGDLIGVILDIHGIAHGINRGGRIIGGSSRNRAANCIIFLIGNGNLGSLLCLGSCDLLYIRHYLLDK